MPEQPAGDASPEVPPNAASRARDRLEPLSWAHDWEGVRAALAPNFRWEDRRPLMRFEGGADLLVKNMEMTRTTDEVRHDRRLLTTLGDRIALEAITWSTRSEDPDFIVEVISVLEVDPDGLLVADIIFDGESRTEAFLEASDRLLAGEGADGPPAAIGAYGAAFAARDWGGLRRALSDDFTVLDHRSIGLFNLGSADEWVAATRALVELVPDIAGETRPILSWHPHGALFTLRQFGSTPDGDPFDRTFINLWLNDEACVLAVELFDVEDLDRALARFYELRPDSP